MREYKLNIGDVMMSDEPASYTCFGLGSCVGLFIQDQFKRFSGGAHIFLPGKQEPELYGNYYHAEAALEKILSFFKLKGSAPDSLCAKVAGGANVINAQLNVGKHNVDAVLKHLFINRVFLAATDVGGSFCRTVRYESTTGNLIVRIPETKEYRLF